MNKLVEERMGISVIRLVGCVCRAHIEIRVGDLKWSSAIWVPTRSGKQVPMSPREQIISSELH